MSKINLNIIASVTIDGSIGDSTTNSLIYRNKEDMEYFREQTLGSNIIMGRKTWESLPVKPLRDRTNIIVSTTLDVNEETKRLLEKEKSSVLVFETLEEAIDYVNGKSETYIVGGASIYKKVRDLFNSKKCNIGSLMYHLSIWKNENLTGDVKFPYIEETFDSDKADSFDLRDFSEHVLYKCKYTHKSIK